MVGAVLTTDWFFLLQLIGVICGVVQVLLAKANKVMLYPFGIASILITLYVLYEAGLYAEILLNLYYLTMSIYGWAYWVTRKDEPPVKADYSGKKEWIVAIGIVAVGFPLLYYTLIHFTDSTVPAWDAWVSATAWAGMWLLAKRKIENWVWLNISNAIAIPLLVYKGLHLYALLTLFLFIVAIFGYFEWKRIIRGEKALT
ncbi:nicotinamide riboside transporter PnuC [Parapedobacter indicus]|uniref:Nicotinamide riboside transporter PnuC n=1 Tax=Parapedobacter indicus TaxID=1477437 RepID=A0A1I3DJ77_9SPHI|nr:nicotinamide riboside transporter PnuC [Parapedobacter indicus]PPL04702.1 nicotinamide mononucleotide transporter [Parapedobacter indicus]SFH86746.1 nicotinamide mononucleotide transporter [Parapedobacter indicus]